MTISGASWGVRMEPKLSGEWRLAVLAEGLEWNPN